MWWKSWTVVEWTPRTENSDTGPGAKFEETTAENFTEMMKNMKPQGIKDKTDT